MAESDLRRRLLAGVQAQVFGHVVRVLVQVGGVSLFTVAWGLPLYGEWLILSAVPTYLAFSDIGFASAAGNEMVMSVARGDREAARTVYRAVERVIVVVAAVLSVALPVLVVLAPVASLLSLTIIDEQTAGTVVVLLGFDAVLALYASLLYSGFACVGRYGQGAFGLSAITLVEFVCLAGAVVSDAGPAMAAGAMLAGRAVGTAVFVRCLRRRVPWLWEGTVGSSRAALRRLVAPALASGAIPVAFAFNLQGMVLLVGAVLGPPSAAVFSTVRTVSRSVIQLLASVSAIAGPEMSRAYGAGDRALLQRLHRRGCQVDVWLALGAVGVLGLFGDRLIRAWTGGAVGSHGALLWIFLAITVIDSLWYTSFMVLFATNRHRGLSALYISASIGTIPVASAAIHPLGLDGVAGTILALEVLMLVAAFRSVLPATQDTLPAFLRAVVPPPVVPLVRLLRGARHVA